ncbi:MAG: HAD family phosphatase [Chitinophagales bacterium]
MQKFRAPIYTLIFDIGNVIIDIDYDQLMQGFKKIAKEDFRNKISATNQESIFDRFEKGMADADEFRNALRPFLKESTSDAEIDTAWNSLIIGFPEEKFLLLETLRKQYRILALSNINAIHLAYIDAQVQQRFGQRSLRHFFDKVYYSFEVGARKPEAAIYQRVLNEESVPAEEMLFIDDLEKNTAAAAAMGIQTYTLEHRGNLKDLFPLF